VAMRIAVATALVLGAASAHAEVARTSLATESDEAAWTRSGFRLGLGINYGQFTGLDGAPSGRLKGVYARAGVRLDSDWSLMLSINYALAETVGELSGLRFAGTVDPTWHITPSLSLAIGVGFGGIVEGRTGRADVDPLGDSIESSYTFPDASTPLPSCSGVGLAGLVRVEYSLVIGPKASIAVSAEALAQSTQCVEDTGRVEPDTARPIERRQVWPHMGGQLALGVTWR
jgi:hypothetical protein